MKKRFVVLLASESEAQMKKFEEFIKKNKLGWWHWLQNSWLIIDWDGVWDGEKLRDELNEIYPEVHKLVVELQSGDWSGFGPIGENRDMFQWLKTTWKAEGP